MGGSARRSDYSLSAQVSNSFISRSSFNTISIDYISSLEKVGSYLLKKKGKETKSHNPLKFSLQRWVFYFFSSIIFR